MGVVESVKDAVKIIQQMDNLDLYRTLLDLQAQVMDLVDENRELESRLEVRDELAFDQNAYWRSTPGKRREGPFCSRCWDFEGKLVRLLHYGGASPRCPQCKSVAYLGGRGDDA